MVNIFIGMQPASTPAAGGAQGRKISLTQPYFVTRPDAMSKRKELDIIEACENTFPSEASVKKSVEESGTAMASGLTMELYEFITKINDRTSPEIGRLLRPTRMDQVDFVQGILNKNGHIQPRDRRFKGPKDTMFWIKEHVEVELTQMKDMVDRGLILKHNGILKALACACSEQFQSPKLVIACEYFDLTLQEWIGQKGQLAIPNGDYLSDQGKDIVRSGWTAIEYIWSKGFTCDDLDKLSTYVMTGTTLKILPFFIRPRRTRDSILSLREMFADLLQKHIAPLWNDKEFRELTKLMKHQDTSFEVVLGHPVLDSSEERLLMYRIAYYPYMTLDQDAALKAHAVVDENWVQTASQLDIAFNHIIQNNFDFTNNVIGALKFAVIVSCHYVQNLKKADPYWTGQLASNHVDLQLKRALPLLLCKRYNLKVDPAFSSKVAFQL